MQRLRRLISVVLVLVFSLSMGITAFATETEETEEEILQREMATAYALPVQSNQITNWPQGPGTYGDAAIVMEVGTGAILYAKNIDDHHFPASITKVLTALVALENGVLTDSVTMSHASVEFLQPGDSSIGLKEGNVINLEQALHATLLASANEAAYAVGENVGINAGYDYNWFLQQMNLRCQELGGTNSNFVNTNGLHDDNHYTCARDMALIGREIFKYLDFFRIVQTMEYKISATDTVQEHIFQQKHKMLKADNENYYEYAIAGKTGYTSKAKSTLITMADNGETQLVCVVLRTYGKNVYPDTKALFEYAFNNFRKVSVDGNESSPDIGAIIPEENSGYVMLPEGVAFEDLEMEFIPDEGEPWEATLNYSYEGYPVGTARAKLSDKYIEAHTEPAEEIKEETVEPEEGMSKQEKIVIGGLGALLIVFLVIFIRMIAVRVKWRKNHKKS